MGTVSSVRLVWLTQGVSKIPGDPPAADAGGRPAGHARLALAAL